MSISCVNFRGHGTESTGSIAHRNQPAQCPTCGNGVNFRGHSYAYEEKKKTSTVGIIAGLAALTAATIIGLGYTHKTGALNKLKDGKMKDLLKKLEPATEKCYGWCKTTKTKSIELWDKIKNMVSSKK